MKTITCIFPLLFLCSCSVTEYISTPDNAIEEVGEAILKYETGIDIDFTLSTPEKK